jgi:hypothetical protein
MCSVPGGSVVFFPALGEEEWMWSGALRREMSAGEREAAFGWACRRPSVYVGCGVKEMRVG